MSPTGRIRFPPSISRLATGSSRRSFSWRRRSSSGSGGSQEGSPSTVGGIGIRSLGGGPSLRRSTCDESASLRSPFLPEKLRSEPPPACAPPRPPAAIPLDAVHRGHSQGGHSYIVLYVEECSPPALRSVPAQPAEPPASPLGTGRHAWIRCHNLRNVPLGKRQREWISGVKKTPRPRKGAGGVDVLRTFGVGCSPLSYGAASSASARIERMSAPFSTKWLAAALLLREE